MERRAFLIAVAVLGVAPAASAQQGRTWRVGFLYFGSRQSAQETGRYAAFLQGMRELGYYTEGKNLAIDARFADGMAERLPELAAELVRAKVDLIVASGSPANLAAKRATSATPIVMTLSVDPVAEGMVASLARPGGNVTGLSTMSDQLSQKHLEILSAVLPKLSRIGALVNPDNAGTLRQWQFLQAAAKNAATELLRADARTPAEIERSLASLAREHPDALIIVGDAFLLGQLPPSGDVRRPYP